MEADLTPAGVNHHLNAEHYGGPENQRGRSERWGGGGQLNIVQANNQIGDQRVDLETFRQEKGGSAQESSKKRM